MGVLSLVGFVTGIFLGDPKTHGLLAHNVDNFDTWPTIVGRQWWKVWRGPEKNRVGVAVSHHVLYVFPRCMECRAY